MRRFSRKMCQKSYGGVGLSAKRSLVHFEAKTVHFFTCTVKETHLCFCSAVCRLAFRLNPDTEMRKLAHFSVQKNIVESNACAGIVQQVYVRGFDCPHHSGPQSGRLPLMTPSSPVAGTRLTSYTDIFVMSAFCEVNPHQLAAACHMRTSSL